MSNLFYVFLGGGIGSALRYFISWMVKNRFEGVFPVATLISNLISCVILGVAVSVFAQKMEASSSLKLFIIAGVCGGFSTFSTFSYETVELMKQGNMAYALANVLISTVVCLGVVYFLVRNS